MRIFNSVTTACLLLTCLAAPSFAGTMPSAETLTLIEELNLTPAAAPVSAQPGWRPQRVAVLLLPAMGLGSPEYKALLEKTADNVELVFIAPGDNTLSKEMLSTVDAVIGICTPTLLKNAGADLRWIHNYFVGMDLCKGGTEKQLADIVFTNNKRLSGPAIAEHTIAMLLALTRNLPAFYRAQTEKEFTRAPANAINFGELKNKTILVVGLGGIGTEIAWRAHGLGMHVIATRRSSREGPEFVDYVGLSDELYTLAKKADVIVNALPLTKETTGLFDKSFFQTVKPGAIFLSIGRGKSTVTADLISALESGRIAAAGLDVTDPEPLPSSSPLWSMPNVIITPHVAAAGADSKKRSALIAIENLRRYVAGEPLLNIVNIKAGY